MSYITLLGDSIFDNKAYVNGEDDVIVSLQSIIPKEWTAKLLAVDGSVVENVSKQILGIPKDTTHLFISVGGNDAILNADILQMNIADSSQVFDELANRANIFEQHYEKMIENLLATKIPFCVCTIYFPNFPDAFIQKISVAALSTFNDIIIRQAAKFGIPCIDLRLVCNEKTDYANEIEPSSKGGMKIAEKILEAAKNHNFSLQRTVIYF